jgi:hypothetical protein
VSQEFSARCPKCGNRSFERPETMDVALDFECHACGHHGKLVEFLDLATLDAVAEDLKRRARETLKSTIGAKALG